MAFEVSCGECGGHLLIEAGGVIVECPLCGAHLSIPEMNDDGTEIQHDPVVAETTTADSQMLARAVVEAHAASAPPGVAVPAVTEAAAPAAGDVSAATAGANGQGAAASASESTGGTWMSHSQPNLAAFLTTPSGSEAPAESPQVTSDDPEEEDRLSEEPTQVFSKQVAGDLQASAAVATAPSTPSGRSTPAATAVAIQAPASADTVPKQYLIIVGGYASAVTLALAYLLLFGTSKAHVLESLPDLVPDIRKDGEVGMPAVKPRMDVAPGHELRLGQTERFGNVRVTPLKVTRGPLQFVHGYGNPRSKKEASKPVLKLWLKFENVSKNQEFPPLDRTLVFRRILEESTMTEFSLNFLCPADQRAPPDGARHFVYDMPEFSEFNIDGQNLGRWLTPGEVWETYIPSEEGIAKVDGEWVWRVLFRKGLNAQSGRGVTTLIDVKFSGDDVTVDG